LQPAGWELSKDTVGMNPGARLWQGRWLALRQRAPLSRPGRWRQRRRRARPPSGKRRAPRRRQRQARRQTGRRQLRCNKGWRRASGVAVKGRWQRRPTTDQEHFHAGAGSEPESKGSPVGAAAAPPKPKPPPAAGAGAAAGPPNNEPLAAGAEAAKQADHNQLAWSNPRPLFRGCKVEWLCRSTAVNDRRQHPHPPRRLLAQSSAPPQSRSLPLCSLTLRMLALSRSRTQLVH
jgi:hypothetical protein